MVARNFHESDQFYGFSYHLTYAGTILGVVTQTRVSWLPLSPFGENFSKLPTFSINFFEYEEIFPERLAKISPLLPKKYFLYAGLYASGQADLLCVQLTGNSQ